MLKEVNLFPNALKIIGLEFTCRKNFITGLLFLVNTGWCLERIHFKTLFTSLFFINFFELLKISYNLFNKNSLFIFLRAEIKIGFKIMLGKFFSKKNLKYSSFFFKFSFIKSVLFTITIIFLSLFSTSLNNCLSFLVISSLPSKINRTTSDNLSFFSVSVVINFWVFSCDLDFFLSPPKSTKLIFKSLNFSESSMG